VAPLGHELEEQRPDPVSVHQRIVAQPGEARP
jgi:hypothetical protein